LECIVDECLVKASASSPSIKTKYIERCSSVKQVIAAMNIDIRIAPINGKPMETTITFPILAKPN